MDYAWPVAIGTTAVGLAVTAVVVAVPGAHLAYDSPRVAVAMETAVALVASLAAVLFAERATRSHQLSDVLLASSLGLLAFSNLLFSLGPSLTEEDPTRFATWGPHAARLVGAVGFAGAALLPDRRLPSALWRVRSLGSAVLATVLLAGVVAALSPALPEGTDAQLVPERSDVPRLGEGDPGVLVLHGVFVALYVAAAVGFSWRARARRDELLMWVAAAAGLLAVSRVDYALFPAVDPRYAYLGDIVRLLAFLVLAGGIMREAAMAQRRAADARVFEERRRLARELHDGLAQELAYIRVESQREGATSPGVGERLAAAATRALEESRVAIAALSRPADEPLSATLRHAAEAVAGRAGATVECHAEGDRRLEDDASNALVRIVREATTNAVRHGHASTIRLAVRAGPPLVVTITDDGSGFDAAKPVPAESFGMTSMRERAEALGGTLTVASWPGGPTRVEVRLP